MALIKEASKRLYHEINFKAWRQKEEKAFLKLKRAEEKLANIYPKPYLDYLDKQEEVLLSRILEKPINGIVCLLIFKGEVTNAQSVKIYRLI